MIFIKKNRLENAKNENIYVFEIINSKGHKVEITNYGAIIKSIYVPDCQNNVENIVVGFDSLEGYAQDHCYIGATVGRFSNRIKNAQFVLDDILYQLDKNDGENCNHGGDEGFHKKIFDYKIDGDHLILSNRSLAGAGGFPGEVLLKVTYRWTDQDVLTIEYNASSSGV